MALAWHRRAGKDEILLNGMGVMALRRQASYGYMFPTTIHARRSMWNSVNPHTGRRRILESFPKEMLAKPPNETEMRLEFVNGSNLIFFGSDNYDGVVGAAFAGLASSEHALAHPSAYAFFSPMLLENRGFFWAISTPRGANHFKDLIDYAAQHPRTWFGQHLSIERTKALSDDDLAEELAKYVSQWGDDEGAALFRQEYHVDFNAAIMGAYFGGEVGKVRAEGRVDPDLVAVPGVPVHRAWDIGMRDDTSIWFFQVVGAQVLVLDFYTNSGAGVDHYADVVDERHQKYGWTHGTDFIPHDGRVREWGTTGGRTRVESMIRRGLNPEVVPLATFQDGIQAVRKTLPRCIFHSRCDTGKFSGLRALEAYHRQWDDEKKAFKATDVHDWSAHLSAAFRYLALAWRTIRPEPINTAPPPGTAHDLFKDRRPSGRIRI